MRHGSLAMSALLVAGLAAAGCATKQHVREELAKTEAKVGADVGRLDAELGQEKARVSGLATQLTETRTVADEATRKASEATGAATQAGARAEQAATRADEAAQTATQATGRADEALAAAGRATAKAEETDSRLSRLWKSRNKRTLADTTIVLFGFDKWALDDRAQTALLGLIKQLQDNPELTVELEGYTDTVGPQPYNIGLSQRRAEAVRRFLVEKGVELPRIHAIGLGDIRPAADNKTKQGRDQNRRVMVRLMAPTE
jgi:outer membrane protein OmpA-like peptidoglycan-associated protein